MSSKLNEMDVLLQLASNKLGTTPEALKQKLESGDLSDAISKMQPSDASKLQKILQNPALTKELLSTPQAQQLFNKLTKGK